MTKRTVKDWEVDGETKLLSTGDKGDGFRKAQAIVRPRDFTHRRVVGFAYRAEDARLFAASGAMLEALELCAAKLAMWPEGRNPELFPSLIAARAAIAKARP